ncbi:MAG: hypothetical protein EBR82_86575 [Caulobacteraceae bacterium]|nr:hypothetical protein [Caulobacteraceae bacterium]
MKILVSILLRQARNNNPGNPRTWLEDLQSTKWTDVSAQNGQIVGTALNGKSITIQALPGASIADILTASELALQTLEAGLTGPSNETRAFLR